MSLTNELKFKINNIIENKKTNVIFSADLTDIQEIINLLNILGPKLLGVKFHSDMIPNFEKYIPYIEYLAQQHNLIIIEDRKFCDIGNTVHEQSKYITKYADLITVHAIPGESILQGLYQNCIINNCGILLIAQMSTNSLINDNYTHQAVEFAKKYKDVVVGFICQKFLCDDFIHFTPGVKLSDKRDVLGQKYNTPEYLIKEMNTDILIVGRGIYECIDHNINANNLLEHVEKYICLKEDHILDKIISNNLIKIGNFKLKSGVHTNLYFDLRNIINYPSLLDNICKKMCNLINVTNNTVIMGIPTGGIPFATIISKHLNIPMIIIKKEQKHYGLLTNNNLKGKDVVVIEDTMTTGSSVLEIVNNIHNYNTINILCIMDRTGKNVAKLTNMGYPTKSLYDIDDIINRLVKT